MTHYRTESVFFAVALALAIGAAAATTVLSPDMNDDAAYGRMGLAKQHQPIDTALVEPLQSEQ
jgi:hypothetical protein